MNPFFKQQLIGAWVKRSFGKKAAFDRKERATRVLEEALELAQAEGVTSALATTLLNVVYSRPVGDPEQEAAGVGVTLLGWANCAGWNLEHLVEQEIVRVIGKPEGHFQARHQEKIALGVSAPRSDAA